MDVTQITGWRNLNPEAIGSKEKCWVEDPADRSLWLFKHARPRTGEDWAEVVAAGLAGMLRMPHATYRLALLGESRGSLSRSFVPTRADGTPSASLVSGNEILHACVPEYELAPNRAHGFRQERQHTVDNVLLHSRRVALPLDFDGGPGLSSAPDVLVGYLMFDAWIGNTDRHDLNWGLIRDESGSKDVPPRLAPTFDHGSSLGRELTDDRRRRMLHPTGNDRTLDDYINGAPSRLFGASEGGRPFSPLEAYLRAAERLHEAAASWKARLTEVRMEAVSELVADVPATHMSEVGREFVVKLLTATRARVLN